MFTGIIEGLGTLKGSKPVGAGTRFTIEADFELTNTKLGDSIAVNGACLTAVALRGRTFEVDVAPETIDRTAFKTLNTGARLNLERALRLSDRLDGHLVSGHIDGTAVMESKKRLSNAIIFSFKISQELSHYMIRKGSVAIDGISLTINKLTQDNFEVSIIPHTAMITTIGLKDVGSIVNIETDIVGKYIEKFVKPGKNVNTDDPVSSVTMEFLSKSGFL
jgi:riboflavin synthase